MNSIEELKKICSSCVKCELSKTRTNVVFGKGNLKAEILIIGEAPGEKEDLQGFPFVGKAGHDLDKVLNEINLNIDDVYITNILKCRPPKNRDPKPEEIEKCTPYLVEQIKIIKPKIICTLGNFSTKFILSNGVVKEMKTIPGVDQLHGEIKKINFKGLDVEVFPLHHPSSIIYSKDRRKWFKEDFLKLEKYLFGENRAKKEKQKTLI